MLEPAGETPALRDGQVCTLFVYRRGNWKLGRDWGGTCGFIGKFKDLGGPRGNRPASAWLRRGKEVLDRMDGMDGMVTAEVQGKNVGA